MLGTVLLTGATGILVVRCLELVQSWIVICISRSAVDLGMIDPSFRERVVPIRVDIKEKGLHQVVDMVEQILRSKSIKLSGLVNNAYYLEVDSYDDVSAEACELAIQGLLHFMSICLLRL